MHDAVLIGIGTAINDNPQLNGQLHPFPSTTYSTQSRSPTPPPFVTAPQRTTADHTRHDPPSPAILQAPPELPSWLGASSVPHLPNHFLASDRPKKACLGSGRRTNITSRCRSRTPPSSFFSFTNPSLRWGQIPHGRGWCSNHRVVSLSTLFRR